MVLVQFLENPLINVESLHYVEAFLQNGSLKNHQFKDIFYGTATKKTFWVPFGNFIFKTVGHFL